MKALSFSLLLLSLPTLASQRSFSDALISIQQKYALPGVAGAFSRDGQITQMAAVGLRKIENEAKLETDDTFHLGSCTKAMTATLAATFVEEGKLSWKSKISDIFPELEMNEAFKETTFDELLAHRTGLLKDPEDVLYEDLKKLEVSEARKKLTEIFLKRDPDFKPLTYNYSNIGYIIAGTILEKLSGKNWETLINERIFSALEMKSCGFGPTSDPLATIIAEPWGHYAENGKIASYHYDNPLFYGPAGTVHCSMTDWNKFLDAHVRGFNGEDVLLKAESFQKLHTSYPEVGETYTYGAWIRLEQEWAGGPVFTHSGSNGLNVASVWFAPMKKAVLMGLTNIGGDPADNALNEVIIELIQNNLTP